MPETFTYKFDTPVFKGDVAVPLGLYIDGKWVDGSDKTTIEYVLLLSSRLIAGASGERGACRI